MDAETLARRLAVAGALFVVVTTTLGADSAWRAAPFALWACLPYGALWLLGLRLRRLGPVLGAGLAALTAEAAVRASVFLWPQGSTSALALLFSPAYILLLVMPAGALLGWLIESVWERAGRGMRTALAAAAAVTLAFEFLAIARPEYLPMNLARQNALLTKLGEPRVVAAGGFESVVVSTASAWFQVDDLDGRPGDELVVADHKGATVLDGTTLQPKDRAPFTGAPGGLWNWYSRLVAMEDGYAVAQTGGGFQKTELRLLDGRLLSSYKPDANLEPTAMRPADLDGDRAVEFYAASGRKVCRLDLALKETWCVDAVNSSIPVLAPPSGKTPGWLVVVEYRRLLRVLDAKGGELGSFVPSKELFPLSAVDLPQGRALVSGGKTLLLLGLDGAPVDAYAHDLEGFHVVNAVPVTFKKGEAPLLAVLSKPRGADRFRLRLMDPAGVILYEELFAKPVGLLPVRRSDGSGHLLIQEPGRLRSLKQSH